MKKLLLATSLLLISSHAFADQLYIEVSSQVTPDPGRSTVAGVLNYIVPGVYGQPASGNVIYDYGSVDNSAATPFPVFTGDVSARAYFDPIWAPVLVSASNDAMTPGFYTTYIVEDVAAPVYADFSALAMVAHTGNYSDLLGTPAIPTVPSNLSAFTNDVPYLTSSSLSGYLTSASASSTYVPQTISVAGHALSSNVTVSKSDVGLGNVANVDTTNASNISSGTLVSSVLPTSGVTAGTYTYSSLTVDNKGRVTTASNGTAPANPQAYEGTSQRVNAFGIFKNGTISSGTVAFNLTNDGTSTGTALFPTGVIQASLNVIVNDAAAAYQPSWAWSNSNKTVTVTLNKLGTANILTGLLGQVSAPNGTGVNISVWGY